jgi:PhnB protein
VTDPFDTLAGGDDRRRPRPAFERALRERLVAALGLDDGRRSATEPDAATIAPDATVDADVPTVRLTPRRNPMTTTMPTTTTLTSGTARARPGGMPAAVLLTPYLAVHDAAAAIEFYVAAFGAVEVDRIVGDDGRIGHAELAIGEVRVYLADEYPEIDFRGPRSIGGSGVTLHLEVPDVDARFATAVRAGSEALDEPADQPHGSRHGGVRDPFGHRWLLSQRLDPGGVAGTQPVGRAEHAGGIWAAVNSHDALAAIRFLVDVLGFEEQLVVPGDAPGVVVHSQLRWPEGGIVQVSTADRAGNVFAQRPVGVENLYVITADPAAVHDRCVAAGVEIVAPLATPDYDPGGSGFSLRDPEGNLWSFGTYAGEG